MSFVGGDLPTVCCKPRSGFLLRIVFLSPLFFCSPISPAWCSNQADLTAAVFAQQVDKNGQDYYADVHPYLDEPLKQIVSLIPELKAIQTAPNQQELPTILEKTGKQVDEFLRNVVNVIAQEKITQEILNTKGAAVPGEDVISRADVQDSYLILRHGNDVPGDVVEYRMDAKGNRLDQVGLSQGYVVTAGFALSSIILSTARQTDSVFRELGQEKISKRNTYVLAFAQIPSRTNPTSNLNGLKRTVQVLVQGIVWIDKDNFQIIKLRTDLLAPRPDIGLARLTTDVTFGEARIQDLVTPLWLPNDVKVYVDLSSKHRFRNEHHYTHYRLYRVSVKVGRTFPTRTCNGT